MCTIIVTYHIEGYFRGFLISWISSFKNFVSTEIKKIIYPMKITHYMIYELFSCVAIFQRAAALNAHVDHLRHGHQIKYSQKYFELWSGQYYW